MSVVLPITLVVISLVLLGISGATLWWMLHAWRDPETLERTSFLTGADAPALTFSLLVPARHEEAVLETTLEHLAVTDHPFVEIIAIVGHDDPETTDVARRVAQRHPERVRVVVDHNQPKNKPKALNTALAECRGDVVGVFDAEDEVDPRLLRLVDGAFRETSADVVQGGVQLVNFRDSWFSMRNCLEYYFYFRSRLHLQASKGFIPLGGNTVFIRTALLRELGGWDAECLAEDCEIGVRLSAAGKRTVVAYDPYLVTREETPATVRSLFKQRTRWNQGFLQVLRKGEWKRLPTRRMRMLARWTLAQPFLQAFAGVAIPSAVAAVIWAKIPVLLALVTWLPAIPTVAMLAFEVIGLRDFCRTYYVRPRWGDYVRLVVWTPAYQVMLSAAAVRAVWRELRGQRGWEKTAHSGVHRTPEAISTGSRAEVDVRT